MTARALGKDRSRGQSLFRTYFPIIMFRPQKADSQQTQGSNPRDTVKAFVSVRILMMYSFVFQFLIELCLSLSRKRQLRNMCLTALGAMCLRLNSVGRSLGVASDVYRFVLHLACISPLPMTTCWVYSVLTHGFPYR